VHRFRQPRLGPPPKYSSNGPKIHPGLDMRCGQLIAFHICLVKPRAARVMAPAGVTGETIVELASLVKPETSRPGVTPTTATGGSAMRKQFGSHDEKRKGR
jgi:6-phosphogluconate dehydrogenase (decarboxylating)